MIKTFFVGILTVLFLLAQPVKAESSPAPETTESLKTVMYFSPLPTSNTRINMVKSQPVAHYLSSILLRPVKLKLYQSYNDIIQALLNNEIPFAELGPLPYLNLHSKNANVTPLVTVNKTPNTSNYECVLAAPFDGIQSIDELNTIENPSVALALIRKEYSVGGLARFIADRYQPLGLEILQSETMPPFVLVANTQKLSTKELKDATKALLNYKPAAHKDFNSLGFSVYNPELFNDFAKLYPNRMVPMQNSKRSNDFQGDQP